MWMASSQDICRGMFIDESCACVVRSVGLQVCGGEWRNEGVRVGGVGRYMWGWLRIISSGSGIKLTK